MSFGSEASELACPRCGGPTVVFLVEPESPVPKSLVEPERKCVGFATPAEQRVTGLERSS